MNSSSYGRKPTHVNSFLILVGPCGSMSGPWLKLLETRFGPFNWAPTYHQIIVMQAVSGRQGSYETRLLKFFLGLAIQHLGIHEFPSYHQLPNAFIDRFFSLINSRLSPKNVSPWDSLAIRNMNTQLAAWNTQLLAIPWRWQLPPVDHETPLLTLGTMPVRFRGFMNQSYRH